MFEDPALKVMWLGKAIPRRWFAEGEKISVFNAPSSYGRISFTYFSKIESEKEVVITVAWPSRVRVPEGGLMIRVRAPAARPIKRVLLGHKPWPFNVDREVVEIGANNLASGLLESNSTIYVQY